MKQGWSLIARPPVFLANWHRSDELEPASMNATIGAPSIRVVWPQWHLHFWPPPCEDVQDVQNIQDVHRLAQKPVHRRMVQSLQLVVAGGRKGTAPRPCPCYCPELYADEVLCTFEQSLGYFPFFLLPGTEQGLNTFSFTSFVPASASKHGYVLNMRKLHLQVPLHICEALTNTKQICAKLYALSVHPNCARTL